MSLYSGKCDFHDGLEIDAERLGINIRDIDFSKYTIQIFGADKRLHKLQIESYKDALKYAPYLEVYSCSNNDKYTIALSSEDYITREENETLNWQLREIKKTYRKLKRQKEEITFDNILNLYSFFSITTIEKELITRVVKYGEKATHEGVHTWAAKYYRQKWYDALIEEGYDENEAYYWVYGWRIKDNE